MATHYSILSVHIRPEIQEKITIGFVLIGEGEVYFDISKPKLSAAKSLLNDNAYRLLKESLRNIENAALKEREKQSQGIFNQSMVKKTFTPEYLAYLSRYNNNLLGFSAPKKIDLEANASVFGKLFKKFIDDTVVDDSPGIATDPIKTFRENNVAVMQHHFNVDKEVTANHIPTLLAPVKIDALGKNEQPVIVQFVELNRRVVDIKNELGQVLLVDEALTELNFAPVNFIVSSEPSKKEAEQHSIWQQLRTNKKFRYVEISEGNTILEYARKHGVQPLIKEPTTAADSE